MMIIQSCCFHHYCYYFYADIRKSKLVYSEESTAGY